MGQVGIGEEDVSLAALQRQHEEEARKLLEKAVPESTAAYCKADTMLLRGKPWREILRIASDRQAELIVWGCKVEEQPISCSLARQRSTSFARPRVRF